MEGHMRTHRHLGKVVHTLSNQIKRNMDTLTLQSVVPMSQGRIIHYLCRCKDDKIIFQKDIEEEFNLRRPSATGILQALEQNGYIERVGVDYDKRLKKIVLTKKGLHVVPAIRRDLRAMEECLKKDISDEDLTTFYKVVDQMFINLK